jgi:hypothetical protein
VKVSKAPCLDSLVVGATLIAAELSLMKTFEAIHVVVSFPTIIFPCLVLA